MASYIISVVFVSAVGGVAFAFGRWFFRLPKASNPSRRPAPATPVSAPASAASEEDSLKTWNTDAEGVCSECGGGGGAQGVPGWGPCSSCGK